MTPTTKICHKCKRDLPITDFYKAKNSKDGLAPSCKDCQWGSPLGTRTSKIGAPENTEPKKTIPGTYAKAMKRAAKVEALAPNQTANAHGSIPTEEPPENVQTDDTKIFRGKDLAFWEDETRSIKFPRAVTVISVNYGAGTAMVEYFKDPTALRITEQKLVKIDQLRRRKYGYQD
jgi:hypothetical protein